MDASSSPNEEGVHVFICVIETREKELADRAFTKIFIEQIEDERETVLVLAISNGSELYQIKEPFKKF